MIKSLHFNLKPFGVPVNDRMAINFPKRQDKPKLKPVLALLRLIDDLLTIGRASMTFTAWKLALNVILLPKNIIKAFTEDRWGSLRISRFFRKVFEANLSRKVLGANLAAAVILTSVVQTPITAFEKLEASTPPEEVTILPEPKEVVITETTFRWPVGGQISQGYHWYHLGIDLANNDNQIIYPISSGKVIGIEHSRWGYGNSIIVEHNDGLISRYAHLSYIKVENNQGVDKNTALGYVGSTGFSTGPHLHLEVIENGRNINPLSLLPEER